MLTKTDATRAAEAFYDSVHYAKQVERVELCQKLSELTGLVYVRLLTVFRKWQESAVVRLLAYRLRQLESTDAAQ